MKKSIHISIPVPCHESWDSMDATARGAFCHSCQKEVIDFSAMTDREVLEYLERNKDGCGRFRNGQLNSQLTVPILDNGVFRWKAIIMSILTLLSFKQDAHAQKPAIQKNEQSHKDSAERKQIPSFVFMDLPLKREQSFNFKMGRYNSSSYKPSSYRPAVENINIKEDEQGDTIRSK